MSSQAADSQADLEADETGAESAPPGERHRSWLS